MKLFVSTLILNLLVVSISWAVSFDYKTCDKGGKNVIQSISNGETLTIRFHSLTSHGPIDMKFSLKGNSNFKPGEMTAKDEKLLLSYAELPSFTTGLYLETWDSRKQMVPLFILDYGNSHKSIVLFIQGLPMNLGKTEYCL